MITSQVGPALMLAVAAMSAPALAGNGADLEVTGITNAVTFGEVDGLRSFAVGFETCNVGDTPIDWVSNTNRHPCSRRSSTACTKAGSSSSASRSPSMSSSRSRSTSAATARPPARSTTLGVGCTNVNSAGLGGAQNTLGPRTEINPATGLFQFPPTGFNQTGDAVFKRLRASVDDLTDPRRAVLHRDRERRARRRGGGQQRQQRVAPRDHVPGAEPEPHARRRHDGGPPRDLRVAAGGPVGAIGEAQTADGGRIIVASRAATDNDLGWRYDYAVFNLDSAINAVGLRVAQPTR
jgi:hypothetical protein